MGGQAKGKKKNKPKRKNNHPNNGKLFTGFNILLGTWWVTGLVEINLLLFVFRF